MAKRRLTIGGVVEIKTKRGLAYALYTHEHTEPPYWGSVIRVFEQVYSTRPTSFQQIVNGKVRLTTFVMLRRSLSHREMELVGHVNVPDSLRRFPLFLAKGLPNPKTGRISVWGLWDGESRRAIYELTPELRLLPIHQIMPFSFLVDRIESDWHEGDDPPDFMPLPGVAPPKRP